MEWRDISRKQITLNKKLMKNNEKFVTVTSHFAWLSEEKLKIVIHTMKWKSLKSDKK